MPKQRFWRRFPTSKLHENLNMHLKIVKSRGKLLAVCKSDKKRMSKHKKTLTCLTPTSNGAFPPPRARTVSLNLWPVSFTAYSKLKPLLVELGYSLK